MSIFEFVIYGNVEEVKKLICADPECVNKKNIYEYTPLHFASFYGHMEIVEILLLNGADYSIKNYKGIDGLWYLPKEERNELIEKCCSFHIKDPGFN